MAYLTKRNKLRKRKCKTMKRGGMMNEETQSYKAPNPRSRSIMRSKPGLSMRSTNRRVLSGKLNRSAPRLITTPFDAKLASLSINSTKFTEGQQFAARIIGIFNGEKYITLEYVNYIASRIPDDDLKRIRTIFTKYKITKNYQEMIDELKPVCDKLDISTLPLDPSEKKRRRLNNISE